MGFDGQGEIIKAPGHTANSGNSLAYLAQDMERLRGDIWIKNRDELADKFREHKNTLRNLVAAINPDDRAAQLQAANKAIGMGGRFSERVVKGHTHVILTEPPINALPSIEIDLGAVATAHTK